MAVINNVKIYSNDGNTLLFTSTNKVYQVGSDNGDVTSTGLTINFVDYGYPSETYTYTGTKKFLGVATSPNATTPTYSVGSQFTFGSLYTLYIVEGEPEEPKITFNITENTEFTLATKGKYCDKDIAVNVAVPDERCFEVVGDTLVANCATVDGDTLVITPIEDKTLIL